MPKKSDHYLGIDLGTDNSFFGIAPRDVLSPNPIYIDGSANIPTALLYEFDTCGVEKVIAFGHKAEEEWEMSTPTEKRNRRLSTHFKPDITVDERARTDAGNFLASAAKYMTDKALLPAGKRPSDLDVLVGVPANALDGHEETTREIARSAGFGDVRTVREPIGALVHHLARKDISARDARGGILIVDFGGGTCDVAYMLRLDIRSAWGDPLLGGRLFDDLFYQWFVERNPGVEKAVNANNEEYYIHWIVCREMKERFSDTMSNNREARFRLNVPSYGSLSEATWDEFVERARRYRPSRQFMKMVQGYGKSYSGLLDGREIDLLGWFHEVVGRGVVDGGVAVEDIRWVILTGGSSAWPFVRESVMDTLRVNRKRIVQSANPRGAIGEGLALLPVLREKHRRAVENISREKHSKIREIYLATEELTRDFSDILCADMTDKLFEDGIVPLLWEFRDKGGTLNDLEKKIEIDATRFQDRAMDMIAERSVELTAKINRDILAILMDWFRENDIHWEPAPLRSGQIEKIAVPGATLDIGDPYLNALAGVATIIMTSLGGIVLGGKGIALLISGLPGLMIGALIGLFVAGATVLAGKNYARKITGGFPIPASLRRFILRDTAMRKIVAKARNRMNRELRKSVAEELGSRRAELERAIGDMIDGLIDDLSELDHL